MNYFELRYYHKNNLDTCTCTYVKRTRQSISHEILVDTHKRSEIHALLH